MATSFLPVIQPSTTKTHAHPEEIIRNIGRQELEGVKVLFINMPLRESARPNVAPEGPLLMATRLIKLFGVEATIIDLNRYRIKDGLWEQRVAGGENLPLGRHKTLQEAKDHIQKHIAVYGEHHLIGFSGKITTFKWQRDMAKFIKQILPNTFLISGGGLATELRHNLFNIGYIPELDGVSHSEGDDVIVKIVYDAITIKRMGLINAINADKLALYYVGEINGRHRFVYAGDR